MRVIAGAARGVTLTVPRGAGTRPITDRVKETLFGIVGGRVIDAEVLDLYAGSGAVGIEALSRGARSCTFVERSRPALATLRRNLARAGLEARARVVADDVQRFLGTPDGRRYDLAVLDPPYETGAILPPLERLVPWLAPGAAVVVKRFWRTEVPAVPGLAAWRERRFGETALTFLELAGAIHEEA
ncbi:MAG TPA: 16S rRNA (guanine(966)-N(2))-methyltransferase RsmD [Candidatus Limnocylindria bacterium]|nr:16S rRNA (guanine(966)-N(2))-methyltransferase RsmD [Candidatus Limnocylindria bacterium]